VFGIIVEGLGVIVLLLLMLLLIFDMINKIRSVLIFWIVLNLVSACKKTTIRVKNC